MLCSKQIYILAHLGACFPAPAHWPAKVTRSLVLVKREEIKLVERILWSV